MARLVKGSFIYGAAAMALAAVPISKEQTDASEKPKSRKISPSKLPLYESPEEIFNFEYQKEEGGILEEGVSVVRKEVESLYEATNNFREQTNHIIETGKAHSSVTLDYIQEEENILPRIGVITVGGLSGLLFGALRKGGLFKKILYSSLGLTGTGALCYPKEASEMSKIAANYAEVYGTVAYNFAVGVKPQSKTNGDETTEKPKEEESAPKTESCEEPVPVETPTPATEDIQESTEKVVQEETSTPNEPEKLEGDIGQGNPEDSDMYTTRGN